MRAREADPLDPFDGIDRAQQLREARADVAAVRVDVLAEQRHLADAVRRKLLDLGEHLTRAPRGLAAADGRNDAVGADGVAAHRDLHPGLEPALAMSRKTGRERTLLAGAEGGRARRPRPPAPSHAPRCEIVPGPNATSTSG